MVVDCTLTEDHSPCFRNVDSDFHNPAGMVHTLEIPHSLGMAADSLKNALDVVRLLEVSSFVD